MRHTLPLGRWAARRTRHRSHGQALVELALILPILMVLLAGALDLGRVFYSQVTIENAAKEGALEAARNPTSFKAMKDCDTSTNRVMCLVMNEAKGSFYSISPRDVSLSCSPSPCPTEPRIGDTVTVKVTGHFSLITPILAVFTGGQAFDIAASAVAQLGVQPDPAAVAVPTPTPTPTPAASPTPAPTPTPTASPTPAPTPECTSPSVTGSITVSPASGTPTNGANPGTLFTFTAPSVAPQPEACTVVYSWSLGDGASGSVAAVTHRYSAKGNSGSGGSKYYEVTLAISVYDADGMPVPGVVTKSVNVPVN